MFENACGLALKNAVIMTTHWDVVGNERAVRLQQELVTEQRYFKPLCDAGANIFGHDNTRGSAQRVVGKLLGNNPIVLQMQEELKTGMTPEKTAAGSQLSADMDALRKKHEAEIKKVREEEEAAMKAKDEARRKKLNDELARQKELNDELARQKELNDELAKLREETARLAAIQLQSNRQPYVPLFFLLVHDLTKKDLRKLEWNRMVFRRSVTWFRALVVYRSFLYIRDCLDLLHVRAFSNVRKNISKNKCGASKDNDGREGYNRSSCS
jgi:hypothetical protein